MNTLHIKTNTISSEFYVNHKAAYKGDSGIDLFFPETVVCEPWSTTMIDLHISCMMTDPSGVQKSYYMYPRSSISKTPLIMHNSVGIIDCAYRGNIKVAVRNQSGSSYTVNRGERLFQICSPDLSEIKIDLVDYLPSSERGTGGFGSSGV